MKLIIYTSEDKKSFQSIVPSDKFKGNWMNQSEAFRSKHWSGLAKELGGDNYVSHEVV